MNNEMYFNYNDCVKSYDTIGETTYHNICTGKSETMPWGVGGWLLFVFLISVIIMIIIATIMTIIAFLDLRRD